MPRPWVRPEVPSRRRRAGRGAALAVLGLLLAAGPAPAAGPTLMVLPLELVDSSLEGEVYGRSKAQTNRLAATTEAVRARLKEAPEFTLLPPEAGAELYQRDRDRYAYVYRCVGCVLEIGRSAGAELILVGWVQKVSNLILNLSIRVYDTRDGRLWRNGWISMRGNTDAMWRRAAEKLVERVLLTPGQEAVRR